MQASDEKGIESAFATLVQDKPDGLLVGSDPVFDVNRDKVVALVNAAAIPAIYQFRDFAVAGGLMSYDPDIADAYRLVGVYTGKILKGAKPADLPIQQPTRFQLRPQSQDGKGAWHHGAASAIGARRRGDRMKRRAFIAGLGAATAWPITGRAQQSAQMRRIGVLMPVSADDLDIQADLAAFVQGLQGLGWIDGSNMRIDVRWSGSDATAVNSSAVELAALAPDAILTVGAAAMGPLLQATRTVPIVFVNVADPVGAGFVDSLAQPGGNATGFVQFEYSLSGKWLELLKQVAPGVTRAAVLRDPSISAGVGQFAVIQSVAPSLGVDVSSISMNVRDPTEIERAVAAFARTPNGGLILTGSALAVRHRDLVVALAARHKLPAVYSRRIFVASGGLISYGADFTDQYRRAAAYVDRILKGQKPSDLPVQAPNGYELVINLKTAKALGLEIPPTLLARADAVIE